MCAKLDGHRRENPIYEKWKKRKEVSLHLRRTREIEIDGNVAQTGASTAPANVAFVSATALACCMHRLTCLCVVVDNCILQYLRRLSGSCFCLVLSLGPSFVLDAALFRFVLCPSSVHLPVRIDLSFLFWLAAYACLGIPFFHSFFLSFTADDIVHFYSHSHVHF